MKSKMSSVKTRKLHRTLLYCTIVFVVTFLVTMAKNFFKSPFFSSGSGNVINSLNESSRNSLIENSVKLNKLIRTVKENQARGNNSYQEKTYRQEISKIYLKLADSVTTSLADMSISHYGVIPEAKEMISGFKQSAYVATQAETNLSELHPQSIGFISLGNSELTNAMSSEARKELFAKVIKLNNLVKTDPVSNSGNMNIPIDKYSPDLRASITENRQKIVEAYKEIAEIISNDLRIIQINNPRIAPSARVVIQGLQESALQSQQIDFRAVEFHPENVNYSEP
jgi:hypothetical protein